MTEQTIDNVTNEQPPTPVPCGICGETDHPTGQHNGSVIGDGEQELSPDGQHNGSRTQP